MKNEAESQAVFAVSYVSNIRGRAMLPDSTVNVILLVNFLTYWVCYPPLFHLIGYVTHPFFILKFELGILHFEKAQLRKLGRKTYIITFNHGPS